MKVGETNPATAHYIKTQQHYSKLVTEKRIIDNLEEARKREQKRRVKECDKGNHVDLYV